MSFLRINVLPKVSRLMLTAASMAFGIPEASACDMCGCFMGLTPYDNQSNVSLIYRLRTFSGYYGYGSSRPLFPSGNLRSGFSAQHADHSHGSTVNGSDYEEYRVVEMRFRYFLHHRIETNLIVPFNYHSMQMNGKTDYLSGIGDVNFFAGYQLLRKMDMEGWQYRFTAGTGLKFASGRCDLSGDDSLRHNVMMQPGTGSTDLFFYGNFTAGINQVGFSITGTYKLNGTNRFEERVENSVTAFASAFYKFYPGNFTVIPSAQMYYEHTAGIRSQGELMPLTGMNVLMAGPGVDVYLKNIQFTLSGQIPMTEEEVNGKMASAFKMSVGLVYNFNQKNYIIKKKAETAGE